MPKNFVFQGCLSLPFITVQISNLLEKRIVGKSEERFISVLFIDTVFTQGIKSYLVS